MIRTRLFWRFDLEIPVCFCEFLNHLLTICLLIQYIPKWGKQGKSPLELPVYQPVTDAYHTTKGVYLFLELVHPFQLSYVRVRHLVVPSRSAVFISPPGQYFLYLQTTQSIQQGWFEHERWVASFLSVI